MSKPKLYMMCGLSGSGKTTFAKAFASEHHLHYINPDRFYEMLNGDECNHYNEFEVWMMIFRALHIAEQDKLDTIFDTNALTVVDRTQILNWFPDFEPILIYICADFNLCLKNNASRRRVIPDDTMHIMMQKLEPPSFNEDARWKEMYMYKNDNNKLTLKKHYIRDDFTNTGKKGANF